MPKPLSRIVAVSIVLSLALDPVWGTSLGTDRTYGLIGTKPEEAFASQALSPESSAEEVHPITRQPRLEFINRARRGLFALAVSPLTAQTRLTPVPPQPNNPQAEQVRQDILKLFQERNKFSAEIDRMFDRSLIGPDAGITREQVHDAMNRFVRFIEGATIQRTRGNVAEVHGENNTFSYNPDYWDDIMRGRFDYLVHEAIHLTDQQVKWSNGMHKGRKTLSRLVPDVESADRRELQSNTEFQHADWYLVSGRLKTELQAYYVQTAFNATLAQDQGISVVEYLQRRQRTAPEDPLIATALVAAEAYVPGQIGPAFKEEVLNNHVKAFPNLVRLLAPDDEMETFAMRYAQGPRLSDDQSRRFFNWANETFFERTAPPGSESIFERLGSVGVPLAIFGGILGSLAFWRWRRGTRRAASRQVARPDARRQTGRRGFALGEVLAAMPGAALSVMILARSWRPLILGLGGPVVGGIVVFLILRRIRPTGRALRLASAALKTERNVRRRGRLQEEVAPFLEILAKEVFPNFKPSDMDRMATDANYADRFYTWALEKIGNPATAALRFIGPESLLANTVGINETTPKPASPASGLGGHFAEINKAWEESTPLDRLHRSSVEVRLTRQTVLSANPDNPNAPLGGRSEPASLPANAQKASVDMLRWFNEVYRPAGAMLQGPLTQGTATGTLLRQWFETVILPIEPDFTSRFLPEGTASVGVPDVEDLVGDLRDRLIIPRGFYFGRSVHGDSYAYGRIVKTSALRTAAGRQVDLHEVELIQGDLGSAIAGPRYIIRPTNTRTVWEKIISNHRRSMPLLGKPLRGSIRDDPQWFLARVDDHLLDGRSNEEAIGAALKGDLEEELSHSDAEDYCEALGLRHNVSWPGAAYAKAMALVREGSSTQAELLRAKGTAREYAVALAVIEVEAKLNAVRRAPVPSYVAGEFIAYKLGLSLEGHQEPEEYELAYPWLARMMAKRVTRQPNPSQADWQKSLDTRVKDMNEFDALLRTSADDIYPREFLTPEERVAKQQKSSTARTDDSSQSFSSGVLPVAAILDELARIRADWRSLRRAFVNVMDELLGRGLQRTPANFLRWIWQFTKALVPRISHHEATQRINPSLRAT